MSIFSKIWRFLFGKKASKPALSTYSGTIGPSDTNDLGYIMCLCYKVAHPMVGGPSYEVTYQDCGGRDRVRTINPNEVHLFCARKDSIKTAAKIIYEGKCHDGCDGIFSTGTDDLTIS